MIACLQAIGQQFGCIGGQELFPTGSPGSSALAPVWQWLSYSERPVKRCLSQKGYTFSNWVTLEHSCDAVTYLLWLNSTGVKYFNHAEQWYVCRWHAAVRLTTALALHVSLQFAS